jgi:phage gpG-like protein
MFRITRNDISPRLTALARSAQRPRAVLLAMGNTFKSITEGTFNSVGAQYRPIPWKAKQDGSPSNLQLSTTLAHAFHLEVTQQFAKLSNSTIYAAIHQFGGVIKAKGKALCWIGSDGKKHFARQVTIPARPFFPVINGRLTPAAEDKIAAAAERALNRR